MGVDVNAAQERVAALTDDEARSLAGKLGAVPAGADDDGWWIAVDRRRRCCSSGGAGGK